MRILLTSARFPHAVGLIRAFGESGHEVYASDTFHTSPGLHSRYVKERILTAPPKFQTRTFVGQIADTVKSRGIDLVVPAFEEVFYLAKHVHELPQPERYFCAPLDTLVQLHDKRRFAELVEKLGLPIAKTLTVISDAELREAVGRFPEYFARAAFSRGGVTLLTNSGPLAGSVHIEDCHPTPEQPWLVQEFLHGEDLCSFTVAHHGQVAAHLVYRHPLTLEHAGGIVFESIDEPRILATVRRLVEHLGYHGSISFDWMRNEAGDLYLVECNPRPTAGLVTMESGPLAGAYVAPDLAAPYETPAGRRGQIAIAILRDMFRDPKDVPDDLHRLLDGTPDVYAPKGDRMPGLYSILSYAHVLAFRHRMHVTRHKHSDLMEAQFFDIDWDGGPLD